MREEPHHIHCVQSLETLEGGGLGSAALALHTALREAGRSSVLLTTHGSGRNGHPDAESFERRGPTRAFFAPDYAARANLLAQNGPSVFHQHGFYAYTSAVCGFAARRHARPLVSHPQGMFDPWILRRSRLKKGVARWLYEDANFRHARLWRAVTAKEADQIRALGFTADVAVIPNGIDTGVFRPLGDAKPHGEEGRTLLFLGRLHPKKGLDLLLKAWTSLGVLRRDWRLVIAGPDEEGYLANLHRWIKRYELNTTVTLPGPLHGSAKLEALQSADAFVLCSHSEGLPMAVLEAMACALPVIVSDECNLPEIAAANCGWICRPNEVSLCEALRELLHANDRELRERGAAARDLAQRRFERGVVAAALHAAVANHFQ